MKTLEEAREFVLREKTCLIFGSRKSALPSLWEVVTLPERQPGERGWGQKVMAIWKWKNELPAVYPDEIYYGKLPNGLAMLMCLKHLRNEHYPRHHRPISTCRPLARRMYEAIRREPRTTAELREEFTVSGDFTRAMVDRALMELQATLNIVRSNAPEVTVDTWLRFTEQYPEFSNQ